MKVTKRNGRLILLIIEIVIVILLALINNISLFNILKEFWFTSGLLLIILLTLIDQPFYSKDANIFINASTAFISLLLLDKNDVNLFLSIVIFYLLISSYVLMFVRTNPLMEENLVVKVLSRINRVIGSPKFLFSLCFLYGIIVKLKKTPNFKYEPFLCFWAFVITADYVNLVNVVLNIVSSAGVKAKNEIIGNIIGVEGKNIYVIKIFDESMFAVNLFDQVIFSCDNKNVKIGMVIDLYFLDEKQWAKIMCIEMKTNNFIDERLIKNYIYKNNIMYDEILIMKNKLVGIVNNNSRIEKISFIYNANVKLEEGMLVGVNINDEQIVYQIVNGITHEEILEKMNKNNNIIVDAIQLGKWDKHNNRFDRFGWVPDMNTPVYIIDNNEIIGCEIDSNNSLMKLGNVPKSSYPVIMDVEKAISHHIAIFGVTGTGKTFFAWNIIKKAETMNKKIIIFDFTREYKKHFDSIIELIKPNNQELIHNKINEIYDTIAKNYGKKNEETRKNEQEILNILREDILDFFKSQDKKSIVELPNIENSEGTSEYLRYIFKSIFDIAKSNIGKSDSSQCLIVLEEAHSIIPEWNFAGDDSKLNTARLNAVAQIALQGRKYNVGLMVIAQRTANVSKSIITQCNTVVSFQEFDNTSIDFLSNYFGDDYSKILPTLKFRQAIACGKAFMSTVPLVFEVPLLNEKE